MVLVQHLFEAHSSEEEFHCTFGIVSCGHVFTAGSSYLGYLTHCYCKHPNWKQRIEESTFNTSIDVDDVSVDYNGISDDRDSTAQPVLDVEETVIEDQNDKEENIKSVAAHFC